MNPEVEPKKKNPLGAGRKWFDGKEEKIILAKLEEVTALDASIPEVVFYADISQDSYYRYLKAHPKFASRLESLRNKPVLRARQTIVTALGDPNFAFKYVEKKRRKEFGNEEQQVKVDVNISLRDLLEKADEKK